MKIYGWCEYKIKMQLDDLFYGKVQKRVIVCNFTL